MNMNISSLWEGFDKKTSNFDNIADVLIYIAKEYNFSEEEALELTHVANEALAAYFEPKKSFRKKGSDAHNAITALFITGVFFGMSLASNEYWHWPSKS